MQCGDCLLAIMLCSRGRVVVLVKLPIHTLLSGKVSVFMQEQQAHTAFAGGCRRA